MESAIIIRPDEDQNTEQALWAWPFLRAMIALAEALGPFGRWLMGPITRTARLLFLIDAARYLCARPLTPLLATGAREPSIDFRALMKLSDCYWRGGGFAKLARIARDPRKIVARVAARLLRAITALCDAAKRIASPHPSAPRTLGALSRIVCAIAFAAMARAPP